MADSHSQYLQELDALSHSLYQAHTARRTVSLALPRSSNPTPTPDAIPAADVAAQSDHHRPRSRRLSMSPWRSHPKPPSKPPSELDDDNDVVGNPGGRHCPPSKSLSLQPPTAGEKKGIWSWKPMRALSHIRMQRLRCLLSVEVVAVQGLPAAMNGLRLSVAVRKQETREGAVQTMPSRVLQGTADFEEALIIRCHVYFSGGAGTGRPLKVEPRPFLISVLAVDAPELDFGRHAIDLSGVLKEPMEKSAVWADPRRWDAAFPLSGKAKGGEAVLRLGFQITEYGGANALHNPADRGRSSNKGRDSSFSVTSPRITASEPSTPTKDTPEIDLPGIDDFTLDEPGPLPSSSSSARKPKPELKDDLDLPEFEVVDKGIEIQSGEVVKEVVHDTAHQTRLTELDAIAQQIRALESVMIKDGSHPSKVVQEDEMQRLDAEEETVTREFLQMLELDGEKEDSFRIPNQDSQTRSSSVKCTEGETSVLLSDLGKGLGSVVQTRDGGYLAAMNPFNTPVQRKETPKLAMQISKPFILTDQRLGSGIEVIQRFAAMGSEELGAKLQALTAMDELMGKTAEQIAFEGIASAIISGRNKEGASSSAARSVGVLKAMGTAMSEGRRERISTGIWNVREEPVTMEEILALSLQKIEAMAVDALKIQADMTEEEPPFEVPPLGGEGDPRRLLGSVAPLEDWARVCGELDAVTMLVIIQLRDPLRRYETVGAPTIAVIQAVRADDEGDKEGRFKVSVLHIGGLKLRSGGWRSIWDGEKQRLTAMQWLEAYGLRKARRKSRMGQAKGGQDVLWSASSRVMADLCLKPIRNPDVKVPRVIVEE